MLELISTPKKWEMEDGEVAEVKTPWTERARELQVHPRPNLDHDYLHVSIRGFSARCYLARTDMHV